jgi:uncharacterized membrane protein (UPF0136 family)
LLLTRAVSIGVALAAVIRFVLLVASVSVGRTSRRPAPRTQ